MNRTLSLLLVISFSSLALLGFSAAAGPHAGCVADAFQKLQGTACPVNESPLSLLASHLGSLQNFVGNGATALLALLALALIALVLLDGIPLRPHTTPPVVVRCEAGISYPILKMRRWTAFHETSPTCFG